MNRTSNIRAFLIALAMPIMVPFAAAGAQAASTGWAAWIGCWEPAGEGAPVRSITCVVPGASADAADFVILAADSVVQRSTIIADGSSRPVESEGCSGTETARFSDDGSRVFLSGKVQCASGPEQETSGVISISETGEWIDVHGVRVGEQRSMRVRRSSALVDLSSVPSEIRSSLVGRSRGDAGARVAAARPMTLDRVEETARAVDERVTEAWLLESSRDGSGLAPIDAASLSRLQASGLPERVIDVVVALSYPKHFQVALDIEGRGEVTAAERADDARSVAGSRMYPDVFGYTYGSRGCYTYSCYMYYADSPYSYGLGGWNSYGGWGMYPGWGYTRPVTVIVRPAPGGSGAPVGGGRVVKGRGYTSNGSTANSPSARPRSEPQATAKSGGSAGSSGGSTTSSSSGSTKSSEPRTAKRKP